MDKNSNSLNWFEIPAKNISRAQKFYESIFSTKLELMEMMGMKMAGFPADMGNGKVSGAVVQSDFHKPSQEGAVIYLNANPSVQTILDRVEKVGGKIAMPRTHISPEIGWMAFFVDSEGNKVGLHGEN